MKKNLLIITWFLLLVAAKAQTFVCTDLNYYGSDMTPQKIQREKAKYLGSKATLTFYDNSLKLSVNEGGKTESIVLDKINGSEYQFTENRGNYFRKIVIKLNKWVEYIRSFTIEFYKNHSLEGTATCKRD